MGIDTSGNSQAIAFNFTGNESDEIFVNSNNNTYGFNTNGSSNRYKLTATDLLINGFGKYIPATVTSDGQNYVVSGIGYKFDL